jgi:hypothetical protein
VTGQGFSLGTPVSSTYKTDCHNATKILLKVAYQVWFQLGVMVFNATFNNIQSYGGGQFYRWRKPEYSEEMEAHP